MNTLRWWCVSTFGLGLAFAMLWLFGAQPQRARAGVLCVNPTGTGGCYDSIQGAVTAAGNGDTVRLQRFGHRWPKRKDVGLGD